MILEWNHLTNEEKEQILLGEEWNNLSQEDQEMIRLYGLDRAIQDITLRPIFFPSLLRWVASCGGSVDTWHEFLCAQGFVSQDEVSAVRQIDSHTAEFYRQTAPLHGVLYFYQWFERGEGAYQSVVLLRPVSITDF